MRSAGIARWLLLTFASAVLAATVAAGIEFDSRACFLLVCGTDDFRSARLQKNAAWEHMRRTWQSYRDAQAIATARRVLPAAARAGDPFVWFAPEVSAPVRASVAAALRRERARYEAPGGRAPVALLVVVDTNRKLDGVDVPWRAASGYSLQSIWPSAATHGWCVAVVSLGGAGVLRGVGSAAGPVLGACSYYDAFGPPSPRLAAALDSGRYEAARRYWPGLPDSLRARAGGVRAASVTLSGYRCDRGSDTACARFLEDAIADRAGDEYLAWSRTPVVESPLTRERASTNELDQPVLDVLAARLGYEQFRELWTRDVEPNESYVLAAGPQAVGVARRLATEGLSFFREATAFGTRRAPGVAVVVGDAVLALVAVLALAAAAMFAARRPRAV
ncbi:MAG: hypothetical protein U9Q74_07150 [Gemmatimonadota bacterium]|nr:hypothetical protein [Gemmatimonadota bacterium]